MTHTLATVLLALCLLAGLVLVPLGLPGLWVMVAGVAGYGWLMDFRSVGVTTIALVLGLALVGEIIETWLAFRLARRYGGSSRAGWGALVGGIVGAVGGVPVPIIGRVIAGVVGSFAGAALFECSRSTGSTAVRARAGAPADRLGPHDQVRPGKHQARLRSQERHEAQSEVGDPRRHSPAPQAGSHGLAELPALSRIVPTDPHRLDRGREAPAGNIRAAARLFPEDDRAEQAGRDGAVRAGASTTRSRPPPPAPRAVAGSRRSSSSPLS